MTVSAVLFDFDGTLTAPGSLDFNRVRTAVGCPPGRPVLEFIEGLPDDGRRRAAVRALDRFEAEAAARSVPNEGAEALLAQLHADGYALVVVTRNSRRSVRRALANFAHTTPATFDLIVTRDDKLPPKPDPAPVRFAARQLGIDPAQILVVGDYTFDIESGHAAGARTVLLRQAGRPAPVLQTPADHVIDSLAHLHDVLLRYRPLPQGKLPNRLLLTFVETLACEDPAVLVGPGVGEDVAVAAAGPGEVVALKADPITFATDAIGRYAVVVNANDIATAGATPRWLLTTLLMPPGVTPADVLGVMRELRDTARRFGIALCGGHTEITDAVSRPVVCGQLIGTVARDRLIDKRRAQTGDVVLLTKGVAVEGTAILARERPRRLERLGMDPAEIRRCAAFLDAPGISVLAEARAAAAAGGVTAMHDVTEGGLATAVAEFSAAVRHRIRVECPRIPVYAETRGICNLLGLNPLGLIGSGSLLICCRPAAEAAVTTAIRQAGVDVTAVGRLETPGSGVRACAGQRQIVWPEFETDELARFFEKGPE
ncbi:MAG: HAD-IA family hydrolase [Kiritimatiellae bacterium]|nr:HAD-IA family hydrolase [Kiritimatiellia bacterium]